jgi:hypothetical protein
LVSGSNMSGKSTLLRTVGINTVLAMAGAPVRAQGLRLTPLQVGASIRVNDSLQEGARAFTRKSPDSVRSLTSRAMVFGRSSSCWTNCCRAQTQMIVASGQRASFMLS